MAIIHWYVPYKVGGSGYPNPKKGRISEISGSDTGYPKISNYPPTLVPYIRGYMIN
uniref:Uncharacterized protein n=1 Tax=Meloidogyne incognita TaxID=6306 RepID=A0A914NQH4_MELIC